MAAARSSKRLTMSRRRERAHATASAASAVLTRSSSIRSANRSADSATPDMNSAAPSAPAPDHLSAARLHPARVAAEMSANRSRTSASEVVGSPSSDHPGPTCAATSRIGAANAAISPLGIAREGGCRVGQRRRTPLPRHPRPRCAEASSSLSATMARASVGDRVGERCEESGADGDRRRRPHRHPAATSGPPRRWTGHRRGSSSRCRAHGWHLYRRTWRYDDQSRRVVP